MPSAEAQVETERPSRYLVQLCRHVGKMGGHQRHRPQAHAGPPPEVLHSECSDTYGVVQLEWGRWTMEAGPGRLTVRAEAADEESLLRIQDLVTRRLETLGRRDGLTVTWQPTR